MTGLEKNVHLPNEHTILVIRYIIVGFNVLMGIFALTLAVYVLMQHDEDVRFEQFMPKNSFTTPVWAAVVGILLLIAAVLAFYASYAQLMYVLIAYITLMVGIFILQAVIGIGIIRYLPELKVEFKKNMENSMRDFPRNPKSWNDLQQGLKCCGTVSPKEWFSVVGDRSVPASCCVRYSKPGTLCRYDESPFIVHQTGCFPKIIASFGKPVVDKLIGFGIALQIIQVINIVFVSIFIYILYKKIHHEGSWDIQHTLS